ncbi:MAG: hypothetical protein AAGA48_19865 [Myxococcota bacterium]
MKLLHSVVMLQGLGCQWWSTPAAEISVPGLVAQLPAGFVELSSSERQERQALAEAVAPLQVHVLDGARRGPRGAAGRVQVQRSVEASAPRYGRTVAEVWDTVEATLRAQTDEAAVFEATERDGGRELCMRSMSPEAVDQTCALLIVDPDHNLVVRAITCQAPDPAICDGPLASRVYAAEPALPANTVLESEGALPRAGSGVWGVAFGSSRKAFRSACLEAGHAVDAYDWSVEPEVVREWFDAGRTSKCGGLPVTADLGPVHAVSAVFEADRLTGLTVFFDLPAETVAPLLTDRYPVSVEGSGQILHVVDPEAFEDQLQSVTLFGMGAEPARLTFLSERGSRPR